MTTRTATLPCILVVDDYHELGLRRDFLRKLYKTKRIKVKELGCNHYYYGVLYVDRLPSKKELVDLLRQEAGWSEDTCRRFLRDGAFYECE